MIFVENSARNW